MTRNRDDTAPLTARVPRERKQLLVDVAKARGTDVSNIVNEMLADAEAHYAAWLRDHKAKRTAAGLSGLTVELNGHEAEKA